MHLERSLPTRIQERLSHYYGIDDAPAVDAFVRTSHATGREVLVLREDSDGIEVALHLPRSAVDRSARPSFDELCQIVEGVSHFLYLVERARRELPATQLELELQAEIDKYVVLAGAPPFELERSAEIRMRLFDRVSFVDPPGTETGDRYRMANDLAARFAGRLEAMFAKHGRYDLMRAALRRFYAAGQTEKLELARAA